MGLDADVRDKMTKLPFFLGGQSLGGALSLLMALRIRSDPSRSDVASKFMGTVLNCPAIKGARMVPTVSDAGCSVVTQVEDKG